MWRTFSLQARLTVLLALVLLAGLVINIGRLVLEAGPRVAAEDQSVVRLARELIAVLVVDLAEAPDPDARLARIVGDLKKLRHVSIVHELEGATLPPARPRSAVTDTPPAWFVRLVHPEQTTVRVPVTVPGRSLGTLVIASDPVDEMAEIWDGIVTQIEVGLAIALALFAITVLVVQRALAPLRQIVEAMETIEGGDYRVRVAPAGSPELADICARLNHLAGALGEAVEEKRQLAERMVSLQDIERREIARELHDEFGPFLFALRAHGNALLRIAGTSAPDVAAIRSHGEAMMAQLGQLQQLNRRVLERLRPAGLNELGLREALGALLRWWREAHPDVAVEMTVPSTLGPLNEMVELTVYRVVQEALTNVFRHAGATRVNVTIAPRDDHVSVRVKDDGTGLAADHRLGLGLTGMRERVLALGGTVKVTSAEQGVVVEASIPVVHAEAILPTAVIAGESGRSRTHREP